MLADRVKQARNRLKKSGQPASFDALAKRMAVMGYPVTGAHLALIESGQRVPSVRMAEGLARVLGEDEELFKSWAQLGGHAEVSDLTSAAAIVRLEAPLQTDLLRDPGVVREWLRPQEVRLEPEVTSFSDRMSILSAEAVDAFTPRGEAGDSVRASAIPVHSTPEGGVGLGQPIGRLTLPVRVVSMMRLGPRAFAFPVTEENSKRVRSRGIGPGLLAISNGRSVPVEMGEIYLVRLRGMIVLSHVWWDRSTFVLLPDHADVDIERLKVDEAELREVVLGQVSLIDLSLLPDIARELRRAIGR